MLKPGEDLQTKLMVFKSTQLATSAQEGVMKAVNSKVHLRVSLAGADMGTLREKHGSVMRADPKGMDHADLFDSAPASADPDPHSRKP